MEFDARELTACTEAVTFFELATTNISDTVNAQHSCMVDIPSDGQSMSEDISDIVIMLFALVICGWAATTKNASVIMDDILRTRVTLPIYKRDSPKNADRSNGREPFDDCTYNRHTSTT